jgi:hypothetical protein
MNRNYFPFVPRFECKRSTLSQPLQSHRFNTIQGSYGRGVLHSTTKNTAATNRKKERRHEICKEDSTVQQSR